MKKSILKSQLFSRAVMIGILAMALTACHGGGGGGSSQVLYYPYETVYGDVCSTMEPTPGCTFSRTTGERITVVSDPAYNQYGHGSSDMWFVVFNSTGTYGDVYDQYGNYQYTLSTSQFANHVGGSYIGVGTSGLFWEDIRNGTYWFGQNGVLYSANQYDWNYGQAINDASADDAADTNLAALSSEANTALVKKGAEKLAKEYGMTKEKATAVASALNRWGVASAERGYTTAADMDRTFKSVFGVDFGSALAAVKDLRSGNKQGMRDMTNRSAAALGLKPHMAQKFIKGMYKKALASWGYDEESMSW